MNTTKAKLIDQAIHLVRLRGYAGFSYADLADAVAIKKPSIHHHFPTKQDLGAAIVDTYSKAFFARLQEATAQATRPREKIACYADLYREALSNGEGCLCGMLAAEVAILPEGVRTRVASFFTANLHWLEEALADGAGGMKRKSRSHSGTPSRVAQASMILGTLQGALVVARALDDRAAFEAAVEGVLNKIGAD